MIEDARMLATSAWHSLQLLSDRLPRRASIAGVACGVLIGWFRGVRYWGMPVLKLVGPIPATALIPLR